MTSREAMPVTPDNEEVKKPEDQDTTSPEPGPASTDATASPDPETAKQEAPVAGSESKKSNTAETKKLPDVEDVLGRADELIQDRDDMKKMHTEVLGGHEAVRKETGVAERLTLYLSEGVTGFFKGKETSLEKKDYNSEVLATRIMEEKIKAIEESGKTLIEKKKAIQEVIKNKVKEKTDAEADLKRYNDEQARDLAALAGLKLDDGTEATINAERQEKQDKITELDEELKTAEADKPFAIEEATNELGIESAREKLTEPLNERRELLSSSLTGYESNLSDIRTHKTEFASQLRLCKSILSSNRTEDSFANRRELVATKQAEIEAHMKNLEEKEKAVKERVDAIKKEKSQVEAYLRRINRAGMTAEEISQKEGRGGEKEVGKASTIEKSPEEIKKAEEQGKRDEVMKGIHGAFGGEEGYNDQVNTYIMNKDIRMGWDRYLSLSPEERAYEELSFNLSQSGDNKSEPREQISKLGRRFEAKNSVRTPEAWAVILFGSLNGPNLTKYKKAMEKMPKNWLSGLHSEEWAVRLYIAYERAGGSKVEEGELKKAAKKKIEDSKAAEKKK